MSKKDESIGRQAIGSWLGGASSINPNLGYPGERLGLPRLGAGSAASMGRRLAALLIDWFASLLVALLFTHHWGGLAPLAVFYAEVLLFTSLLGSSAGQRFLRIRVVRVSDRGAVPFLAVIIRSILLFMVVPAAIYDRDGRGLHDRAAGTIVVRSR
jgi:uncharacterized RDD family membrane protein YckC